jgi:hypothetical protein
VQAVSQRELRPVRESRSIGHKLYRRASITLELRASRTEQPPAQRAEIALKEARDDYRRPRAP